MPDPHTSSFIFQGRSVLCLFWVGWGFLFVFCCSFWCVWLVGFGVVVLVFFVCVVLIFLFGLFFSMFCLVLAFSFLSFFPFLLAFLPSHFPSFFPAFLLPYLLSRPSFFFVLACFFFLSFLPFLFTFFLSPGKGSWCAAVAGAGRLDERKSQHGGGKQGQWSKPVGTVCSGPIWCAAP